MSKQQIDRLLIGTELTSRAQLFEHAPEHGQSVLQKAWIEKKPVLCECHRQGPGIALSTVKRDSRYHLRRLPGQGHLHDARCVSYGGINERAAKLYTDDAISETGDGIRINLSSPLSELTDRGFRADVIDAEYRGASESQRRSTMSMLGLLCYLWEESGLNRWWPNMEGRRYPGTVRTLLLTEAQERQVGHGMRLSELLFIPDLQKHGDAYADNAGKLANLLDKVTPLRGDSHRCYAIVIGELARVIEKSPKTSGGLVLLGLKESPLWDPHGLVAKLDQRFAAPMKRLRARTSERGSSGRPDLRLFGIFAVAKSPSGATVLKHGAVMETNARFIPVASEYERRVAFKLHSERRAFEKPLVYDGERSYFPDFYLLDTDFPQKPVLEVYGYNGDEYEAKKRVKHVNYVRQRIPYWHWDVGQSPNEIPSLQAFPPSSRFNEK